MWEHRISKNGRHCAKKKCRKAIKSKTAEIEVRWKGITIRCGVIPAIALTSRRIVSVCNIRIYHDLD